MLTTKIFLQICLVLLTLTLSLASGNKEKCNALVLEGGGDKGAYQAGVILGLINDLKAEQVEWDVISGISIGSINGAVLSLFEIGKEKEAIDFLINEWRTIDAFNLYKNWLPGGKLEGLLFKSGIYTTEPGYQFLEKIFSKFNGLKRDFVIGGTNVETGEYNLFNNTMLNTTKDLVDGVMSSAAFPAIFPTADFRGNVYIDGGVKYSLDIPSAVNACRQKGYDYKDIIVDVVLCSQKSLGTVNPEKITTIPSLLRTFAIQDYTNSMRDLEDVRIYYPNLSMRYVIAPTKQLPSDKIPLKFDTKQINTMIEYGLEDAKNIIEMGEGKNLDKMIYEHRSRRDKRYEDINGISNDKSEKNIKNENRNEFLKFLNEV